MREDTVGHIKPAVRSPGKPVQKFVPIIQTEAGEQNGARIGNIIVIRVLKK